MVRFGVVVGLSISVSLRRRVRGRMHPLAALSAWAIACSSVANTPGYPLYAQSDNGRLPKEQVAHLFGGIAMVDDREVSTLGGAYELLPGCHLVRTQPENLATGVGVGITVRGQLIGRTFSVRMKPGYSYLVKYTAPEMHDWPRMFIVEVDPSGAESQVINPATREEINACKEQRAGGD